MQKYISMYLGYHCRKDGTTMHEALKTEIEYIRGAGVSKIAFQIFVCGPQNYHFTLSDEEKAGVRGLVTQHRIRLIVHGAYVDFPWKRSPKGISNIKSELIVCQEIGAKGLVVHLGDGANDPGTVRHLLAQLAGLPVSVRREVTLYLEINSTKQSEMSFEDPVKLVRFYKMINELNDSENPDSLKIGLCIDTAHVFASGYSFATRSSAEEWLDHVRKIMPANNIMFHLNDCKSELGSGYDIHETLTHGNIWKQYGKFGILDIKNSGLISILNFADEYKLSVILERKSEGIPEDILLIKNIGYVGE